MIYHEGWDLKRNWGRIHTHNLLEVNKRCGNAMQVSRIMNWGDHPRNRHYLVTTALGDLYLISFKRKQPVRPIM